MYNTYTMDCLLPIIDLFQNLLPKKIHAHARNKSKVMITDLKSAAIDNKHKMHSEEACSKVGSVV